MADLLNTPTDVGNKFEQNQLLICFHQQEALTQYLM